MNLFNQFKKQISKEEALIKAQKYCAYRDRCIFEVETKLKEWGLKQEDIDDVVDDLVENSFVDEKRFATSFVRGKFNSRKWGRYKIKMALKEKHIHADLIEHALKKLEEKEYRKIAKQLIERKIADSKDNDDRTRRSKVYYYMLNKGYEPDVVIALLNEVKIAGK